MEINILVYKLISLYFYYLLNIFQSKGDIVNNKREGKGTYLFKNGDRYEGD